MSDHVHVRVREAIAVTQQGELTERFRCGCGQTWQTVYGTEAGPLEE